MRRRTAWSTVLACWALAAGACEELNVDDNKDHNADTGDDSSGGSSSGGSSSGGSSSGGSSSGGDDSHHDGDHEEGDDAKPPHVILDRCGGVEGVWGEHGVRKFLGIPYAKEPSGELRWAAPQRPDKWSEDLKATQFARACPRFGAAASKGDKHPEDCLFLNVWAPGATPKKPLPVMVWFHGGDHLTGSAVESRGDADNPRFDGTLLATKNVVVVTINYRLGPLGFLPIGAKKTRTGPLFGNQGMWDQAFALQWVQENIEVFGGDPDNVTIFGQGSGAVDVCMHVASPQSGGKDLFHGAISQSGGCTQYQPTSEELAEGLHDWLDKLDCKSTDAEERLGCLRDKSVAELFGAIPDLKSGKKWFTPSVDGLFLPDQPRALFEDQRAANVPYILGSNANDASALLDDMEPVDSEDAYHQALAKLFPSATEEERCEAYPHDAYPRAKKPYQTALAHVLADGAFACSVLHTAVRARAAGSAVYSHHFTGPDHDADAGADYGADVDYVFGAGGVPESGGGLRDAMQAYWTSFASEGYPGKHGASPEWPQIGTKPRKVFRLGSEVEVLLDFRKLQCALWDDAYDAAFKTPVPKQAQP